MGYVDNDEQLYIDEWTRTQLAIWREKVERLNIIRSGAFHQSFNSAINDVSEGKEITMKFLRYGIYQELGVGYGYYHDNGGDLKFLDKEYRVIHKLDEPRKVGPAWGGYKTSGRPRDKRVWYSKKLYMSIMAMKEDLCRIIGEKTASVICDALTDTRNIIS